MKSNTKKRLIAFMLCMVLVLSSAISAFADDLDTAPAEEEKKTGRRLSEYKKDV